MDFPAPHAHELPPTMWFRMEEGKLVATPVKKHHLVFDFYDCPVCGSKITLASKHRHEKTKKHKQAQEVWFNRFDMK